MGTTTLSLWPITSGDYAQWVSAIGTILVVILATFGEGIRKFFSRPILNIHVGSKLPFFETTAEKNSLSTAKSHFGKIKIKVENNGYNTADGCSILVEKIAQQKPDNRTYYIKKEFQPTALPWAKEKDQNIVPKIPSYLEFAQIRREEKLITSSGDSNGKDQIKYVISIRIDDPANEGQQINLEAGTYLIPIVVYATNLRSPVKKFLYIFWDGKAPDKISPESLTITIMSNKEADDCLKSIE
ncbi:MAG: hypothetical protein WCV79_03610 [Candidatus Paceibacterota bacterium]|jgi:hypothetical protein